MERESPNQRLTALEATSDAENEQQPAATNDNGPVFHPLSRLTGANDSSVTLTSALSSYAQIYLEMLATVAMPKLNLESSSPKLSRKQSRRFRCLLV